MDEATTCGDKNLEGAVRRLLRGQPPDTTVIDRVALQRHRGVAVVTLSHPQALNALNLASWRRLKLLLDELAGDSDLRVAPGEHSASTTALNHLGRNLGQIIGGPKR